MPDSAALVLGSNFARSDTRGYWKSTDSYQKDERVIVNTRDPNTGILDDFVFQALADNTGKDPEANGSIWTPNGTLNVKMDKNSVIGLEIIEDVIFDKRKSRLVYDIVAIGISRLNANNEVETPFYIKYSELLTQIERLRVSKDPNDRMKVLWQNRYNPAESKTYGDAFKLRLFHGVIKKVENPDNQDITTIYKRNGRSYSESVFARWEEDMKMMEKEHNLWEY